MKQTPQPYFHLVSLLILMLVVGYLFLLTQKELAQANRLQAEINLMAKNQIKLEQLTADLPALSDETEEWLKTLPTNEKGVAIFANDIESLARANNLIISLSLDDFPAPIDISGHYINGLGAEITLQGSYQGTTAYLAKMADMPYFFKVDKITMTKLETRPGVKTILSGALMMNLK